MHRKQQRPQCHIANAQLQFGLAAEALGRKDIIGFLGATGTGVHPGQDAFAHRDEYVGMFLGAIGHRPWFFGGEADNIEVNTIGISMSDAWTRSRAWDRIQEIGSAGQFTIYDPSDLQSAQAIESSYSPPWNYAQPVDYVPSVPVYGDYGPGPYWYEE